MSSLVNHHGNNNNHVYPAHLQPTSSSFTAVRRYSSITPTNTSNTNARSHAPFQSINSVSPSLNRKQATKSFRTTFYHVMMNTILVDILASHREESFLQPSSSSASFLGFDFLSTQLTHTKAFSLYSFHTEMNLALLRTFVQHGLDTYVYIISYPQLIFNYYLQSFHTSPIAHKLVTNPHELLFQQCVQYNSLERLTKHWDRPLLLPINAQYATNNIALLRCIPALLLLQNWKEEEDWSILRELISQIHYPTHMASIAIETSMIYIYFCILAVSSTSTSVSISHDIIHQTLQNIKLEITNSILQTNITMLIRFYQDIVLSTTWTTKTISQKLHEYQQMVPLFYDVNSTSCESTLFIAFLILLYHWEVVADITPSHNKQQQQVQDSSTTAVPIRSIVTSMIEVLPIIATDNSIDIHGILIVVVQMAALIWQEYLDVSLLSQVSVAENLSDIHQLLTQVLDRYEATVVK